MTDYFTADLHLGHRKVAEIRRATTVSGHDHLILGYLRSILKPGDRLWILGDVSGGREEQDVLDRLQILASKAQIDLHLIAGNHDSIHPMHRHSERAHQNFRRAFTSIDSMGTFRHDKRKIMLSHFPYEGDRGVTRYPEYRLPDTGVPIIHGHTHSSEKVSYSAAGTLQICVSLDAWGLKPVSKETLVKIINEHEEGEPNEQPPSPARGAL